tara:strand:- start:4084 stop:4374 length:291 start_codon:yes stop_codon:yes gene_type:complete
MFSEQTSAEVGNVYVVSTENRGHTPEELADMALSKILYVGTSVDPILQQQALEYRDQIKAVLIQTISKAMLSERTTLYNLFKGQGHEDMAEILRKL